MPSAKGRKRHSPKDKIWLGDRKVVTSEFVLIKKMNDSAFKINPIVTKKVAPRAVDRNRIRRLIKESLKVQSHLTGEITIIVKRNIAPLKMQQVRHKLLTLSQKI